MLLLCNNNNYFPRIKPLKWRIIIPYLLLHPPPRIKFHRFSAPFSLVQHVADTSSIPPSASPLPRLLRLVLPLQQHFHNFQWSVSKKRHLSETFSIHRVSSVFNTDTTFAHVNNAKYLMYMDFAREDFWCRTKLSSFLWRVRAIPLQSASIIRYMIPIPIFTPIRVDTKVRVSQLLGGECREEKLYLLLVGLVGRKDALLGAQVRD